MIFVTVICKSESVMMVLLLSSCFLIIEPFLRKYDDCSKIESRKTILCSFFSRVAGSDGLMQCMSDTTPAFEKYF